MWQRFFLAFLIGLFLLIGVEVVCAQGRGDNLKDQGQQQPLNLSIDLSLDRYHSQAKNQEALRGTDIKENTESGIPKAKSSGPSSKQHEMSSGPSQGPQLGASESGLIGMGSIKSSSSGSKSFLDGYLLKSLHEGDISNKHISNEKKPKDDLDKMR